jgi:ABC-type sugar transport system ATPase subunit
LGKDFGDVAVLHSLDLAVGPGELLVLVGPSGCAKTTVLRLIAGLDEPTRGQVRIGGREVTALEPAERDVAMVFQNYALYPNLSVRENLAFPLRMRRRPAAEIATRTARVAEALGLGALLERRPGQLSGGQRQRVAVGRAMVREPAVFLLDEPLSNLDARLRAELRDELAGLHARLGASMIYVTHDQVEAMTLGQRIAVLRDGRLQQLAPPLQAYREPANLFVAGFLGTPAINTLAGTLRAEANGSVFEAPGISLRTARRAHAGPATLGVRPEALVLVDATADDADCASGVTRLEPLGNELLVHLEVAGGAVWIARADPDASLIVGERVGIRLDRARLHLFGGAGDARLVPEAA